VKPDRSGGSPIWQGGDGDEPEPLDERELIARARAGDARAFEGLVNMHAQAVYNVALRVLRDPVEAEDVAQEAFVRAWRALPRFRADARLSTWLYRIATNLCYDRLPRLRSQLLALGEVDGDSGGPDPLVDETADEAQDAEEIMLAAELRGRIHAAVDALPESYRILITLRHVEDLSYAEVAAITGLPLGTVKIGIFRARRLLRQALGAEVADGGATA